VKIGEALGLFGIRIERTVDPYLLKTFPRVFLDLSSEHMAWADPPFRLALFLLSFSSS